MAETRISNDAAFTWSVAEVKTIFGDGRGRQSDPQLKGLSEIVDELNEPFGINLYERDQLLFDQFEETWPVDPDVVDQARSKTLENLRVVFDHGFLDTAVSRGAVIVSGPTEQGALPIWCAKSKVAEELGAPAARDVETNWSNHIFRQIEQAGVDLPELKRFIQHAGGGKDQRHMTQALWDEQVDLGARHGVFTLATSWTGNGEAVEGFIEGAAPGKLVDAKAEVGDSKIRKGLVYAPSPGEILSQPDGTVAR